MIMIFIVYIYLVEDLFSNFISNLFYFNVFCRFDEVEGINEFKYLEADLIAIDRSHE